MTGHSKTIVFFSRYIPSMGGIENYTHSLAKKLIELGNNVLVITTDGEPGISCEDGIQVCRLRKISLLNGRYPIPNLVGLYKKIIPLLNRYNDTCIVLNGRYYVLSNIGARIANLMGLTPILIDHSSSFIPTKSSVLSSLLKNAEIVTTNLLKRYNINYYGVSRMSSKWLSTFDINSKGEINNAIDVEAFNELNSGRLFLNRGNRLIITYAGRLIEDKGVLQVAKLACSFPTSIDVIIAGSGPLEDTLTQLSKQYNNLHFVGRLNHPDLSALLNQTDVFCFPSRYPEGMPTCLLEAAACKCALVTLANGGTDEIIPDPSYGFVLKSGDDSELTALIERFIDNPLLYKTCASKEYERVLQTFSWNQTALKLLEAFER